MIIKICGIRSLAAARAAQQAGADMLGFVFADSRRYIDPEQAAAIGRQVAGIAKVGVFVNASLAEVKRIAALCALDYVQLHGEETPEYCRRLELPVIKAFRFNAECSAGQINQYKAAFALLDSYCPGQSGGTGLVFDWRQAQAVCRQIRMPVLAAGGLNAGNAAEAIALLQPAGVDVSGGVETNGVKDIDKIDQFIQAVRAVRRRN